MHSIPVGPAASPSDKCDAKADAAGSSGAVQGKVRTLIGRARDALKAWYHEGMPRPGSTGPGHFRRA